MTNLQGECSYRRAEEEEVIRCRVGRVHIASVVCYHPSSLHMSSAMYIQGRSSYLPINTLRFSCHGLGPVFSVTPCQYPPSSDIHDGGGLLLSSLPSGYTTM